MHTLVEKNMKMYLKYIYFVLSILQIHLHIYMLNKNALQLYFWYTILVYFKSAKLEQLVLCLMQINCVEVQLYLIVLKWEWNYCKYTPGTL